MDCELTERNEKGDPDQGDDPWAGFIKAFWLVFGSACIYLVTLLYFSFHHYLDVARLTSSQSIMGL